MGEIGNGKMEHRKYMKIKFRKFKKAEFRHPPLTAELQTKTLLLRVGVAPWPWAIGEKNILKRIWYIGYPWTYPFIRVWQIRIGWLMAGFYDDLIEPGMGPA